MSRPNAKRTVVLAIAIGALLIGLSLGLLGSGGSILTVPLLISLAHQEVKVAVAGSLAIVGTVSLAGSLPYMWQRRIDWPSVLLFGLPGMAGTYLGAYVSKFVSETFQLGLFVVVMVVAARLMLRARAVSGADRSEPRRAWKIALDGLAVGVLTGLVGVGGGFLIVPALVLLGGLPMTTAVGTSLVIIALKSFSGFYKYLDVLHGEGLTLDTHVLTIFTVVGVAGTFIGNGLSLRVPQTALRRIFGFMLFVVAAWMVVTRFEVVAAVVVVATCAFLLGVIAMWLRGSADALSSARDATAPPEPSSPLKTHSGREPELPAPSTPVETRS
ncbi:MAG: sulfite exporter TauE/SafE family protein, partial [Planctomycetes bacterium]|nr:sulfite exporter TauE/SafE family protein [Planctomycetota bacterium]